MLLKSRESLYKVEDVLPSLKDIADKRQEHFVVLTFDGSMQLIGQHLVFLGTVNSSICHPREVFAVAIDDAASGIVVSHNHPSSNPSPSMADISATRQLVAAGKILGIPVIDHLIVTGTGHYFSFLQDKLL